MHSFISFIIVLSFFLFQQNGIILSKEVPVLQEPLHLEFWHTTTPEIELTTIIERKEELENMASTSQIEDISDITKEKDLEIGESSMMNKEEQESEKDENLQHIFCGICLQNFDIPLTMTSPSLLMDKTEGKKKLPQSTEDKVEGLTRRMFDLCPNCKHNFCQECLEAWRKKSNSCPLCRYIFAMNPKYSTPSADRTGIPVMFPRRREQRIIASDLPFYDLEVQQLLRRGVSWYFFIIPGIIIFIWLFAVVFGFVKRHYHS